MAHLHTCKKLRYFHYNFYPYRKADTVSVFYKAAEMLESDEYNTAFTYTDPSQHITFIIIGKATCADEFFNTFIHEIGHAAEHIATYYQIKSYSEELQYLTGEIAL